MSIPLTVADLRAAVAEIQQVSLRLSSSATQVATRADHEVGHEVGHEVAEVVKDLRAAARQLSVVNLLLEPSGDDLRVA